MIPPSWRICDDCGAKHDVERVDSLALWLCFDCRCKRKVRRCTHPPGCTLCNWCGFRAAAVVLTVLALLMIGCAGPSFKEGPTSEQRYGAVDYDFAPGSQCVLLPEKLHAPDGACFTITADEWSTLATCDGTEATDYVGKTWTNPTSYPTSSFIVPGGGCFQFYNCTPEGVLAPTVEPCR